MRRDQAKGLSHTHMIHASNAPSFPCACGWRCWQPGTPQQAAPSPLAPASWFCSVEEEEDEARPRCIVSAAEEAGLDRSRWRRLLRTAAAAGDGDDDDRTESCRTATRRACWETRRAAAAAWALDAMLAPPGCDALSYLHQWIWRWWRELIVRITVEYQFEPTFRSALDSATRTSINRRCWCRLRASAARLAANFT